MAKKKFDGVIEAVHYKNGQIVTVRAYERRGSAFSDRVLIDRKDLLERIKNGKLFVIGARQEFLAGTFSEAGCAIGDTCWQGLHRHPRRSRA